MKQFCTNGFIVLRKISHGAYLFTHLLPQMTRQYFALIYGTSSKSKKESNDCTQGAWLNGYVDCFVCQRWLILVTNHCIPLRSGSGTRVQCSTRELLSYLMLRVNIGTDQCSVCGTAVDTVLNPVTGRFIETLSTVNCRENEDKESGNGTFQKPQKYLIKSNVRANSRKFIHMEKYTDDWKTFKLTKKNCSHKLQNFRHMTKVHGRLKFTSSIIRCLPASKASSNLIVIYTSYLDLQWDACKRFFIRTNEQCDQIVRLYFNIWPLATM